ncbi:RNA polymerase sigma factor [Pseudolysinimonas sp.]|uniref:RNA polymerase sigma factor n=1 Tax=Pseudolysinimonas sp. TaxID=2680009 RepID=UPI00286B90E8|nr:RNA polymerase sigma factor [Pseudolysinimonas sp.]
MTAPTSRFEVALAANARDLLAYFERRVVPREDAADLLAETMIVAWRRETDLPTADEEARRWLFGVARKVLLNAERGARRRQRLANRVRDILAVAEAPAADAGDEVRDAIARLDPDLAELIRLVHWDGLTLADAATILDIPASTTRGRYQRAKSELRSVLAPNLAR